MRYRYEFNVEFELERDVTRSIDSVDATASLTSTAERWNAISVDLLKRLTQSIEDNAALQVWTAEGQLTQIAE